MAKRVVYQFLNRHEPLTEKNYIKLKQTHSNAVHVVSPENLSDFHPPRSCEGDGLVTKLENVALTVRSADCIPLLAYDETHEVIGACHLGWKGIANGMAKTFLESLVKEGASKKALIFRVGPHIQECHFEVHNDVAKKILGAVSVSLESEHIHPDPQKRFISLQDILTIQLEVQGVGADQIERSSICTYCDEDYFSYRREVDLKGHNESLVIIKP